jgi:hypothetical protein
MPEPRRELPDAARVADRELSEHIFAVSAQLVGICLTVLGLFRAMIRLRSVASVGDDLLALDAIAFLAACVFSYASLRSSRQRRGRILERIADTCFGLALVLMTGVCVMVAWELV